MAVPLLGAETITHRRFAAGSRGADGRYTPGSATDTSVTASVQKLSGRDSEVLPEGSRRKDFRRLYLDAAVSVRTVEQAEAGGSGALPADHFVIDSIVYKAWTADDWRATHPLPHRKVIVRRLREPEA